ncbi:uncharacterized protein HaLaN_13232, partial [Haematococcus lacustris]
MLSGVSDTQPGVAAVLKDEYAYFLEFAATVIQRHFRGYLVRRDFYRQLNAIKRQQAAAEENEARLYLVNTAARIIQRAWQSFRNKRIYRFYRDLIQFRERGDPKEMLRAINPREAQLADAAAGVHVRFRLGGSMFPPLVFYKIYTHRPGPAVAFALKEAAKAAQGSSGRASGNCPGQ